ncbi:helix-turn-helix domain-containing protein, partial [Sphingobacterium siyangense]|uniref:helix-turn-helix domain-containing protein n=1 Tax=Sphingobacterium siyangense TaxID=459529 RepID=UPI003016D711
MEEGTNYVKRTQRDYTLTLKLNVIKEIESGKLTLSQAQKQYGIQGDSTIRNWLKKYGNFD